MIVGTSQSGGPGYARVGSAYPVRTANRLSPEAAAIASANGQQLTSKRSANAVGLMWV